MSIGVLTDENAVSLHRLGEQLRNIEQRYEGLFEDTPVACHEIDQNGLVLRVNRTECDLLGFEPHEMIGRPVWEFMSVGDSDRSQRAVRRKLSGEEPLTRVEREYKQRNGTILTLDVHPTLIRDAQGFITGIRSFMVDITERKHAQHLLERQAAELSRSNAELEQFAYVASHDLQEPLRKILAFGDRLRKKYGDVLGEDGLDYLTRMQSGSARLQTLIQDLLALSRVATSPREFHRWDLADVVKAVLSDLEPRIESLHGRVEVGPLPVVMGDRVQLNQLFQNLIGNGLKFHKPGEAPVVRIHTEYDGGWLSSGATCRIFVQDQGIGFDSKYSERIFQIFQRLHGRGEYEGSGIGLSICRKIVERHGGSINVESEPGAGSKFIVTLPYGPFEGELHHG